MNLNQRFQGVVETGPQLMTKNHNYICNFEKILIWWRWCWSWRQRPEYRGLQKLLQSRKGWRGLRGNSVVLRAPGFHFIIFVHILFIISFCHHHCKFYYCNYDNHDQLIMTLWYPVQCRLPNLMCSVHHMCTYIVYIYILYIDIVYCLYPFLHLLQIVVKAISIAWQYDHLWFAW